MTQPAHHLITGENDHFLYHLKNAIRNADNIDIGVAFVFNRGLQQIWSDLEDALGKGAQVRFITGDYRLVTEPDALRALSGLGGRFEAKVFECSGGQSFHLKTYIFTSNSEQNDEGIAFVGSSNISTKALTSGIEWNLRIHQKEDKERFKEIQSKFHQLYNHSKAVPLTNEWIDEYRVRFQNQAKIIPFDGENDLPIEAPEPNTIQQEALKALNQARLEGKQKGLVVLATGMGKTWLSAFDSKAISASKILFIAHREEILNQAAKTFAIIHPEKSIGRYNGTENNIDAEMIFASVQTLGREHHLEKFASDHFDYIVVDEFHHASAKTYKKAIRHFNGAKFLLGLTATPERTDQADILELCDHNLIYRKDLFAGIENSLLAPFHYFGIADDVQYDEIPWRSGRFDPDALSTRLSTERRAKHAFVEWKNKKQSCTLGFCISVKHADFMADYFQKQGIKAVSVHSQSRVSRTAALEQLAEGTLEVIFSVDLFNEGVDVPLIDTVLMLRPTESKIVFLQQLGRGLRLHERKSHLIVIDFIGNHTSFFKIPEALFGIHPTKSDRREFIKQNKKGELKLPEGCSYTWDVQVIEFMEQLVATSLDTQLDIYRSFKETNSRRPSLTEFYLSGGNVSKVRLEFKGWFHLVVNESDMEDEFIPVIEKFSEFLLEMESTAMTRSFKMILAKAFLQNKGLNSGVSLKDAAFESYQILKRMPELFDDVLKKFHPKTNIEDGTSDAWVKYWRDNPVNAWVGGNKKNTVNRFRLTDDVFTLVQHVAPNDEPVLSELLEEIIEFRFQQYLDRKQKKQMSAQTVPVKKPAIPVPFFPDLQIACGHFAASGHDLEGVELLEVPEENLPKDISRSFIARAKGNSMNGGKDPILDGDHLLLEWITPENAGSLQYQIVALERQDTSGDDQYLLRKVTKDKDGLYQLLANNPDYAPVIGSEEIKPFARLKKNLGNLNE